MFLGAIFTSEIFQSAFRDNLHLKHVEATFSQLSMCLLSCTFNGV